MYKVDEYDYDNLKKAIREIIIVKAKAMKPGILADEILNKMDDVIIRGMIP